MNNKIKKQDKIDYADMIWNINNHIISLLVYIESNLSNFFPVTLCQDKKKNQYKEKYK